MASLFCVKFIDREIGHKGGDVLWEGKVTARAWQKDSLRYRQL